MRIINNTTKHFSLTDVDWGVVDGIYESWNAKQDTGIPASGQIDLLDSDRVMLSTEMGQILKLKTAGYISTAYSLVGREVGPFVLAAPVTFEVTAGSVLETVSFAAGSYSITDVVNAINASVTGFVAEECSRFFRASNTDNVIAPKAEGTGGVGYGQRGRSIISGFLTIYSVNKLTVGSGTANSVLGFTTGQYTRCK